jgi:arylsulfatase A-like enzyme
MIPRLLRLALAPCSLLLSCAISAWGDPADGAPRPNVLVLMADDWSWPHAGALGDPVVKTPTFDRLAREGVLFEHAFVSSPSRTPSRFSVASGQHHWRLQSGQNPGGSLPEGTPVYPELLQEAGYRAGFTRTGAQPSEPSQTGRDPFGARFDSFAEFLTGGEAGKPFCFWYGAGEPHRPYLAGTGVKEGLDPARVVVPAGLPDNETTRRDLCDYLERVQRFDRDAGRILDLLEKAGELENTIVVMTSARSGLHEVSRCGEHH